MMPQGAPGAPSTDLIKEMLMRRMQGAQLPTPGAGAQMMQPSGALPTGGPNTPMPNQPPGTMPMPPAQAPQQIAPRPGVPGGAQGNPMAQTQGMIKGAGQAMGPNFDDQTRQIAKMLIGKLVQHI